MLDRYHHSLLKTENDNADLTLKRATKNWRQYSINKMVQKRFDLQHETPPTTREMFVHNEKLEGGELNAIRRIPMDPFNVRLYIDTYW